MAPNGQRCTAPVEWYPAVAGVELTRRGWVWSIEVEGSDGIQPHHTAEAATFAFFGGKDVTCT